MYFAKCLLRKTWLVKCLTSRVSDHPSTDSMGDGSKHCFNLNDSISTIFINHWSGSYIRKRSLLVIYKILRLFVNTLTADDKHYLLNKDNLTQPIQMQVSQKRKNFRQFLFCIFKIYMKFPTFAKKRWPP